MSDRTTSVWQMLEADCFWHYTKPVKQSLTALKRLLQNSGLTENYLRWFLVFDKRLSLWDLSLHFTQKNYGTFQDPESSGTQSNASGKACHERAENSAQKIVRPETEANHIIKKQCQNIEENMYNVRTFVRTFTWGVKNKRFKIFRACLFA